MTETTGGVFRTVGPYESKRLGANGRLAYSCEAKIVDPQTGIGLPPFKHGELRVRGPLIMRGQNQSNFNISYLQFKSKDSCVCTVSQTL